MDILYRKNHPFIVNLKRTNFLGNKIGLVLYTQMYRLMQNSTTCLASQVLLEMEHTCLSIYTKLCDLDRDLKQTAFILLTQKFSIVGFVITGQRHTFATLKSSNVISLFQCKAVS